MSNQFERFQKKSATAYNLRCPACGDSKKNKMKARGYFYQKEGNWYYDCKNCHHGATVASFMKEFCSELYNEYTLELLRENSGEKAATLFPSEEKKIAPVTVASPLKKLKKISQLHHDHPAKLYITSRKIPAKYHAKLYYCPDFTTWVNEQIPGKLAEHHKNDKRIIIPFLDENGRYFGCQGRSLSPDGIRYISIITDDTKPKVFGLDTVDWSEQVYAVEGPFDSMFIPNTIAACGSDIPSVLNKLDIEDRSKVTIIFDNEKRNLQIIRIIEDAIEAQYNMCLWPLHIEEKDINDMVLARGDTAIPDLKLIIDHNTFSGLAAQMALVEFKK